MKIRSGFVSNSSSSSFIMVGVTKHFDSDVAEYNEFRKLWELDHQLTMTRTENGDTVFGYNIITWDEYYYDACPVDMNTVTKLQEQLKTLFPDDTSTIYVGAKSF